VIGDHVRKVKALCSDWDQERCQYWVSAGGNNDPTTGMDEGSKRG